MQIMRLTDERELVRLFAFRYRVFVDELGWMARKDRGAHILVDEFDQESANYAAYDADGEIVGSLRVVPDGPLGLPLERCQVLNGYRARKRRIVELSRLAVAPRWRCTMLAALLMKAGYQCAESIGATHLVLDTYTGNGARLDRLYDRLGFDQLTEPVPTRTTSGGSWSSRSRSTAPRQGPSGRRAGPASTTSSRPKTSASTTGCALDRTR